MKSIRPVSVSRGAFAFCRWGLAILAWVALVFQIKWLVVLGCLILLLSAILKIKNAPMIQLYSQTINRIWPSDNVVLDQNAMFFAHSLGAFLFFSCSVLLYFTGGIYGWIFLAVVAVLKTVGAIGWCAAGKLYGCLNNPKGSCCSFIKRK